MPRKQLARLHLLLQSSTACRFAARGLQLTPGLDPTGDSDSPYPANQCLHFTLCAASGPSCILTTYSESESCPRLGFESCLCVLDGTLASPHGRRKSRRPRALPSGVPAEWRAPSGHATRDVPEWPLPTAVEGGGGAAVVTAAGSGSLQSTAAGHIALATQWPTGSEAG